MSSPCPISLLSWSKWSLRNVLSRRKRQRTSKRYAISFSHHNYVWNHHRFFHGLRSVPLTHFFLSYNRYIYHEEDGSRSLRGRDGISFSQQRRSTSQSCSFYLKSCSNIQEKDSPSSMLSFAHLLLCTLLFVYISFKYEHDRFENTGGICFSLYFHSTDCTTCFRTFLNRS